MSTKELVKSEVEDYAKFDLIRYAQVWEDADILLEALKINENESGKFNFDFEGDIYAHAGIRNVGNSISIQTYEK